MSVIKFEKVVQYNFLITAGVEKRAKVIFSQACVTHSVHVWGGGGGGGGVGAWSGGGGGTP